ncbi:synaptonemal complex protein 2-like isoform X2 [Eriocheir sinensis]|uniref:synaptonemal complex protein 2-like isoform X2 n=1 Tax=Eriocheir sinensis TaxID=95602 RepID=UPI0021C6C644|nr:synaptonemal complex protein 2-like isoform X2 [Eriocheir sinensis]XP_050709362.1 synaptonemal complex protein 2-like isoform X2 [Eriocheir sinensis]
MSTPPTIPPQHTHPCHLVCRSARLLVLWEGKHHHSGSSFEDSLPHCRHSLKAYNSTLGGSRQVFAVPCYTMHIGNLKLCKPKSVSYPRVWIDFNLGTSSILILCQVESTPQPSHPVLPEEDKEEEEEVEEESFGEC